MKALRQIWHALVWVCSGEWMLRHRSNGGGTILARSVFVTGLVYLATIGFRDILEPNARLAFDLHELTKVVRETVPWIGAIFAGVYVTFYSRFSSQWTYLAGVYNQIKAAQVQACGASNQVASKDALAEWKAGFIEDADALHLSEKKMMRGIIRAWLPDAGVQSHLAMLTPDGDDVLARLCASHALQRLVSADGKLFPPAT